MNPLNERKLRPSKAIESRDLPDGLRLLKQTARGEYLALTAEQQRVLELFDGHRPVQEVLHSMLTQEAPMKIRAFYDLVIGALQKGFLLDGEQEPSSGTIKGRQWPVHTSPAAIIGLSLGVMIAGMSVFNVAVFEPVVTVQEWLWLLALVAAGLSVSHLLAGFALSGLGRQVYAPVLRLDHGLPYFSVDVRDAFMGGRMTEVCVALQTLAGPFVLAVVAGLWDLPNALLASWLTMLILTSPFGHTPAHNILHALFRKEYELPKCAERFLNTKMVAQMFNWRETLHEERYFLAYSTYAILWLGLVYRFASRMLETQGNAFADLLTRTGAPSGRWTMLVVFTLLALFVAAPLAYGAWVLLRGGYRLLAPRLFNAESALRRRPDGSHRPETAQVTRFLANTLLFSQLPLEELEKVAAAMKFIRVEPGTFLVRERDFGNLLFIVHTGSVEVLKENEAGEPLRVATLGAGDVFGEIGLLDEVPRTSSVRSTGAATLFTLKKEDFERLLVQTLGAKKIKEIVQVCAFLKRNPLFAEWHPQPLLRLSGAFAFQDFNPGDVVIQENKPNDSFYLVHDGQFEVRKKGQPCATLGPGDFCGEISLLRHTPATAEVAAVKPGRCLKLGKNDFFQLVSQSFLTGLTIETALDARTAKGGLRWARS